MRSGLGRMRACTAARSHLPPPQSGPPPRCSAPLSPGPGCIPRSGISPKAPMLQALGVRSKTFPKHLLLPPLSPPPPRRLRASCPNPSLSPSAPHGGAAPPCPKPSAPPAPPPAPTTAPRPHSAPAGLLRACATAAPLGERSRGGTPERESCEVPLVRLQPPRRAPRRPRRDCPVPCTPATAPRAPPLPTVAPLPARHRPQAPPQPSPAPPPLPEPLPAPAPPRSRQRQRGGGRSRCVSARGGRKGPAAPRETVPRTSVPAHQRPPHPTPGAALAGSRVPRGSAVGAEGGGGGKSGPAGVCCCGPRPCPAALRLSNVRSGGYGRGGPSTPRAAPAPLGPGSFAAAGLVLLPAAGQEYRPVLLQQPLHLSPRKTQHLLPGPGHGQGWLEPSDRRLRPALYNAFVKQLLEAPKSESTR